RHVGVGREEQEMAEHTVDEKAPASHGISPFRSGTSRADTARAPAPRSRLCIRRAPSRFGKLTCGAPGVDLQCTLDPRGNFRMPSTTRRRLTEAATRRFYRDGFRNVGLEQVLTDVGISKTAFYKHFDCKEDLVLAALELKNQWLQDTFRQMVRESGGPTFVG